MMRLNALTPLGCLLVGALALVACDGGGDGAAPSGGGGEVVEVGPGKWEALPPLPGIPRLYTGVAAARGRSS